MHDTLLDEYHQLVHNAKDINLGLLRNHLVIDHAVGVTKMGRSKSQLGKAHLLAHAVEAYPELRELLGLSPEWGRG